MTSLDGRPRSCGHRSRGRAEEVEPPPPSRLLAGVDGRHQEGTGRSPLHDLVAFILTNSTSSARQCSPSPASRAHTRHAAAAPRPPAAERGRPSERRAAAASSGTRRRGGGRAAAARTGEPEDIVHGGSSSGDVWPAAARGVAVSARSLRAGTRPRASARPPSHKVANATRRGVAGEGGAGRAGASPGASLGWQHLVELYP